MTKPRARNRVLYIGEKPIIEFDESKLDELRAKLSKLSFHDLHEMVKFLDKEELPSDIVDYVKSAAVIRSMEELAENEAFLEVEERTG